MPKQSSSSSSIPWRTVCITAIISFSIAIIGISAVDAARTFQIQSLIAGNIASEGLEALQSIRNTNWLRYDENTEKCWLTLPQINICSPENTIKAGYYALRRTTDIGQWELTYAGSAPQSALDLNKEKQANKIYLVKDSHGATALDPTDYFRMIRIESVSDEKITVTSVVMWKTIFGVQTVHPATSLTNYTNFEND